jgi:hypothetical protein
MDPIAYHIRFTEGVIQFETADLETLPADRRIERFLNETNGATKEKIMEACNIENERSFDNALSKMRKRGKLETTRLPNQSRWYSIKRQKDIS